MLLREIAFYFAKKAMEYHKEAMKIRAFYPKGSYGYAWASIYDAFGDLCLSVGEAFVIALLLITILRSV